MAKSASFTQHMNIMYLKAQVSDSTPSTRCFTPCCSADKMNSSLEF